MKAATLINQDSGDVEYYTPPEIVEAARRVMGVIDLDPFSSNEANERVKATHFFTPLSNGLIQPWFGNVWMNHPFSRQMNQLCVNKIENEFAEQRMKQGCCITFAATSEKWFQPLLRRLQCFLSPRTNYYLPDGTVKRGVTKGSVVTYYGKDSQLFAEEFKKLGVVKVVSVFA